MDNPMLLIGVLTVVVAALGVISNSIGVRYNIKESERAQNQGTASQGNTVFVDAQPISERLLCLLWDYPKQGGSHASWAVKTNLQGAAWQCT